MGICLDTEQKPLYSQQRNLESSKAGSVANGGMNSMSNSRSMGEYKGKPQEIHFETPRMPVIFVIGGPGSGKITHSESLVLQRRGYTHVNMIEKMTKVLENTDMNDLSAIPSSQVVYMLMNSLKSKSNVYGYIVSGYPRHIKDVEVYSQKIGRCDGVILLNWTLSSLERQIEYGARLGEIDLDLAKIEFRNFRENGQAIANYYDYKQLLYVINGERQPKAIFKDFLQAFEQILDADVKIIRPRPQSSGSYRDYLTNEVLEDTDEELEENDDHQGMLKGYKLPRRDQQPPQIRKGKPMVIWIIGGPGSSKTDRMSEIATRHPTWRVISVGRLLWQYLEDRFPEGFGNEKDVDSYGRDGRDHRKHQGSTAHMIRALMYKGEMVPQGTVLDLVMEEMSFHADAEGFFLTGFPKDIVQAQEFEEQTDLKPPCVLIDCSELELGRNLGQRHGRLDDTIDAYKRRLELYRELTLPMLKTLDEANRLKIVDGDSDHVQVLKELRRCIHREVGALRRERAVESIDEDRTGEKGKFALMASTQSQ